MVGFRFNTPLLTRFRLFCLGLIGLQLVVLSGCKKQESIRTYTVPHRERPRLVYQRMLGAIIPNGKEAWFFKLQGPDDEIGQLEPDFLTFTKSVSIQQGKVTWKAPDKWKERPGGEFRITTFLIPHGDAKPFELAVSRLDAPEGVNDQYLVMNLSRWRGQLQREPITPADIPNVTTKVDFDGGSAWVVNMTGFPSSSGGMGMPPGQAPFAGHPPVEGPPPERQPAAPAAEPGTNFEFTTPKGWSQGRPSSMRKASLMVADDDSVAEISVFQFPAAMNKLLPNINRWRGEVGLKEVTEEELQKTSQKIDVAGHSGDYVELVGEKDTILGVMVVKGESAWFYKLKGPTALAGREKARFEEFVKTSRLP